MANSLKLGDVSKNLKITNKDVIAKLAEYGIELKSASSVITEDVAGFILDLYTAANTMDERRKSCANRLAKTRGRRRKRLPLRRRRRAKRPRKKARPKRARPKQTRKQRKQSPLRERPLRRSSPLPRRKKRRSSRPTNPAAKSARRLRRNRPARELTFQTLTARIRTKNLS